MALGLYDNGFIIYYTEGDQAIYRNPLVFKGSVSDVFHTIREGETLLTIARKFYGTSFSWFVIADANPEVIDDIFSLPVGEVILIPKILVT